MDSEILEVTCPNLRHGKNARAHFSPLNVQDVIRRGGVEGFHFFDGFIKTIGTRGFGSLEQQAVERGVKSGLHIFLNVIDAE